MTTAGQGQNFFPGYRVFVFGIEVTDDVLSVGVTHADDRAPSTCEILLVNKAPDDVGGWQDRYVVTEGDIQAMTPRVLASDKLKQLQTAVDNAGRAVLEAQTLAATPAIQGFASQVNLTATQDAYVYAVTALQSELENQVQANLTRVPDLVKQKVLATKAGRRQTIENAPSSIGDALVADVAQIAGFAGQAMRYPFQVGDCIFHSNDPVRVFMRDPQVPNTWYHMFAGFVSDWTEDVDENNVRTVTLRCEDVLRVLRYARFSTSPGLVDISQATTSVDLVVNNTFASDDFSKLTMPEFLFSLVFGFTLSGTLNTAGITNQQSLTGKTTVERIGPYMNGPVQAQLPKDGVGLFSYGRSAIYSYGPAVSVSPAAAVKNAGRDNLYLLNRTLTDLGTYQAVVDHEVRRSDVKTMFIDGALVALPSDALFNTVTSSTAIDDVVGYIGTHPELYPVDGGRMFLLVPSKLDSVHDKSVLDYGFKGIELKSKVNTRLAKIYDVLERFEFSFYATGKGDILAEFPLRDFDPQDFGTAVVSTRAVADITGLTGLITLDGAGYGPFQPHYVIKEEDTYRWSRTFSDEKVRTLVLSTWWNFENFAGGETANALGFAPGRYLCEALVPQFGVRGEEVEPNIRINDKPAADLYARLQFNRFNSDARSLTLSARPRLRLMPNRPLMHQIRDSMSNIRQVATRVEWGEKGSMEMSLRSNYLRAWDGAIDANGRWLYSYLGGFAANQQNYALLLQTQDPPTSTQDQTPPKAAPPVRRPAKAAKQPKPPAGATPAEQAAGQSLPVVDGGTGSN